MLGPKIEMLELIVLVDSTEIKQGSEILGVGLIFRSSNLMKGPRGFCSTVCHMNNKGRVLLWISQKGFYHKGYTTRKEVEC